ncbi:MAG: hypothetical protein JOY69_05100, partial [Candidatus Eremiobacteraeota bacterium]|nr:hypothetical protein [Candidatus Eremiobacteraeota bacterium]
AINGSAAVTFQSSNLQMTLVSAALQAGSSYEVDVFAAGAPGIVESYGAGTPKNGKLKFQSPFSGIAIAPGTPVTIELAIVPYPQTLYVSNDYSSSNSSPGVYLFNGDSFGSSAQGFLSLAEAGALAVDDAQNLYVGACIPNTECFANEYSPALQGLVSYYTSFYPQWCGPTGATVASGANPAVGVSCSNVVDTFPQGSGSPQSSYPDSNLSSVDCVAFDAAGNQYVGGVNSRSGSYEVDISGPGGTWSSLGLELVEYPAQLTLDSSGNLLVAEPGLGVAVFTPGQAAPSAYIDYGADTISLALGNGGNWLYVYQGRLNNNDNSVNVYRYPAGTLLGQYFLYEFNGQIAVAPRVPLFNPAAMRRTHPGFRYWTDTIAPRPRAKEH